MRCRTKREQNRIYTNIVEDGPLPLRNNVKEQKYDASIMKKFKSPKMPPFSFFCIQSGKNICGDRKPTIVIRVPFVTGMLEKHGIAFWNNMWNQKAF